MPSPTRPSGIFYGWWVVLACFAIAAFSSASRYSFTMFLPTLLDEMGWTRTMLGFGLTLHMWVYALSGVLSGVFVDKFGPRYVMAGGGLFILAGLALVSRMQSPLTFFLSYGIILAIGVAATLSVSGQATAGRWFVKKAGTAMAFAAGGIGFGFGMIALVAPGLISAFGWRSSWLYLGIFLGSGITILALVVVRKDPQSMGLLPDGILPQEDPKNGVRTNSNPGPIPGEAWTVWEALRTRSYWCILIGYGLIGINYVGISGHLAAWAMDIAKADGVPAGEAMRLIKYSVFFMAVISTLTGFIGGPISDRIGRKPVFAVGLTLAGLVSIYAAMVDSLTGVVGVGLLSGFFMGFTTPLWGAYLGDIFGRASLATLFGLLTFTMGIVGGSGPVIFGKIFDVSGSYKWAWFISAASLFAIVILMLFTRQEKKPA